MSWTCPTLRDYLRAALGEREAAPGAIVCIQSFGALVHRHPHLHVLVTDGAFRRDGTFLPAPPHHPAVPKEAWWRAVLEAFVRAGWLEEEAVTAMLGWPRSGSGAHVGPAIAREDREELLRGGASACRRREGAPEPPPTGGPAWEAPGRRDVSANWYHHHRAGRT